MHTASFGRDPMKKQFVRVLGCSAGILVASFLSLSLLGMETQVASAQGIEQQAPVTDTMPMDHTMPMSDTVPAMGDIGDIAYMMEMMKGMAQRMAQMEERMSQMQGSMPMGGHGGMMGHGAMTRQGCPMTGATHADGSAEDGSGQTPAMTATVPEAPTSPQVTVHDMGAHVMPFDLSRTTHIFEMTESGGIQEVVVKDPGDVEQVALIQQHMQHEAALFSAGNFSDPLALHGNDMPGVKDLSAGAAQVQVEYSALPNGARIVFTTEGIHLLTALHRWFGAQLSDHGADATYR
jgi:hypothetical protein